MKFTQVNILVFPNFLQFSGNFWDFPNYFCPPNFLIHFPKSRNQFLMDSFFFSFPAQPARPLLQPWPASQPKPTPPRPTWLRSPLGPSSPRSGLISYIRPQQGAANAAARLVLPLRPSRHGQPSPSCVRRAPLLHHPPTLFPL
jgi:hypothetical protein